MGAVLFTADDIAEMRAFNDANLPDTVGLRSGTRSFDPGTGKITWAGGDPTWVEPCRVSPASAPQEQVTAGSLTEVKQFYVVTRAGVIVPQNTGTTLYRLEWTHGIAGLATPILLYLIGTPLRSYRMLAKFLTTTVAPQ